MGYLKDVHSNLDIQAFPGARFEIAGDVPTPQCSEAKIEGDDASTENGIIPGLDDPNAFAGYALTGKVCTITVSPTGNLGDFNIVGHTHSHLSLDADPGFSLGVHYYIHDGGELILTRNAKSFAQFIHAAGYAYTIKGGKLYTTMPSELLKNACTILFDPLT